MAEQMGTVGLKNGLLRGFQKITIPANGTTRLTFNESVIVFGFSPYAGSFIVMNGYPKSSLSVLSDSVGSSLEFSKDGNSYNFIITNKTTDGMVVTYSYIECSETV